MNNASDLPPDPFTRFRQWFDAWIATGAPEPHAMVLATVDAGGMPWQRTVLLKQADNAGFVFFTNRESNKGLQLAANARASLHFLWLDRNNGHRQVLVQGHTAPTSPAQDDAYFASRPRESQLGAWASVQSRPLASREELLARFHDRERQYAGGPVPRPPHWGGYCVIPERIEFWQAGAHRLHDRFVYARDAGDRTRWTITRLNP
ncbi:MAG: pyridoxamine 5'-phosphate oxidase [Pseudomonadota bacterium]